MVRIAEWTHKLFYSFDIESTGVDVMNDHIATCCLVKFNNKQAGENRGWTLRPAVPMPAGATEIHGITDEFLTENGTDAKAGVEEITAMLAQILNAGIPLVVFNAAYDLSLVESQCKHYELKTLPARLKPGALDYVVDPLVLSKGFETLWKKEFVKGRNHKLPSVCERYGVPFVESHDATADAVGAGLLAIALVNSDNIMSTKGPRALAALHKEWREKNQASLRAYFNKNGIEHDGVDAGWPLHTDLLP